MRAVNDRKLLLQLETPDIAGAKALARWIKVAICIGFVAALISIEISASLELMQSYPDLELTH